jgi:hypothetical protein
VILFIFIAISRERLGEERSDMAICILRHRAPHYCTKDEHLPLDTDCFVGGLLAMAVGFIVCLICGIYGRCFKLGCYQCYLKVLIFFSIIGVKLKIKK